MQGTASSLPLQIHQRQLTTETKMADGLTKGRHFTHECLRVANGSQWQKHGESNEESIERHQFWYSLYSFKLSHVFFSNVFFQDGWIEIVWGTQFKGLAQACWKLTNVQPFSKHQERTCTQYLTESKRSTRDPTWPHVTPRDPRDLPRHKGDMAVTGDVELKIGRLRRPKSWRYKSTHWISLTALNSFHLLFYSLVLVFLFGSHASTQFDSVLLSFTCFVLCLNLCLQWWSFDGWPFDGLFARNDDSNHHRNNDSVRCP